MWKMQALENFVGIFGGKTIADDGEEQVRELGEKVVELTVEPDF